MEHMKKFLTENNMENKTVDVYVVMVADEVMGVYDTLDEAQRMTSSYYDAVVEGPEPMEITSHDKPTKDMVSVHVLTEGDSVLGVYDSEDEAESICNNYYGAEVSEEFILEFTHI
jgi:flavoprotein